MRRLYASIQIILLRRRLQQLEGFMRDYEATIAYWQPRIKALRSKLIRAEAREMALESARATMRRTM